MTKLLTDAEIAEIEARWNGPRTLGAVDNLARGDIRQLLADRMLLMVVAKAALPLAEWFIDLERTKVRLPDTNEKALIEALRAAGLMESENAAREKAEASCAALVNALGTILNDALSSDFAARHAAFGLASTTLSHHGERGRAMLDVVEAVRPIMSPKGPVTGSKAWQEAWRVLDIALARLDRKEPHDRR